MVGTPVDRNRTYNPTISELTKSIDQILAKNPLGNWKDVYDSICEEHKNWKIPERRVAKFVKRRQSPATDNRDEDSVSVASSTTSGSPSFRKYFRRERSDRKPAAKRASSEVVHDDDSSVDSDNASVSSISSKNSSRSVGGTLKNLFRHRESKPLNNNTTNDHDHDLSNNHNDSIVTERPEMMLVVATNKDFPPSPPSPNHDDDNSSIDDCSDNSSVSSMSSRNSSRSVGGTLRTLFRHRENKPLNNSTNDRDHGVINNPNPTKTTKRPEMMVVVATNKDVPPKTPSPNQSLPPRAPVKMSPTSKLTEPPQLASSKKGATKNLLKRKAKKSRPAVAPQESTTNGNTSPVKSTVTQDIRSKNIRTTPADNTIVNTPVTPNIRVKKNEPAFANPTENAPRRNDPQLPHPKHHSSSSSSHSPNRTRKKDYEKQSDPLEKTGVPTVVNVETQPQTDKRSRAQRKDYERQADSKNGDTTGLVMSKSASARSVNGEQVLLPSGRGDVLDPKQPDPLSSFSTDPNHRRSRSSNNLWVELGGNPRLGDGDDDDETTKSKNRDNGNLKKSAVCVGCIIL